MGVLIGPITTNVVLGYEYWEIRVHLLCISIGNLAKLGVSGLAKLRKLSAIDGYAFFGVERAGRECYEGCPIFQSIGRESTLY